MRAVLAIAALVLTATASLAEGPLPERRIAISRNVDFYGADLRSIFDTTLDACQAACLSDGQCVAFTFNQRSRSCFPKSGVSEVQPYDGAISARVYRTDPAALTALGARLGLLDFLREEDLTLAGELAEDMGRLHSTDEMGEVRLLDIARERRQAGQLLDALKFTGAALALTDAADLWVDYSILARNAAVENGAEQRRIRERAVPAAIAGYLRATGEAQEATALMALAEALEEDGRGRDMIPALRLAQSVAPRRDVEALLEEAIGKYGFRVADTQVESDSARPRICAEMTEPLVAAGVDYAPYVQLPEPGLTVEAEGRQLCIDGVSHGARYRVVLREGLPAESGETLARPVELTLYVRDRSPQVRFASRGYVLPASGPAALPVESVNIARIDLELRHVNDRNLVRTLIDDLFARPLYAYSEDFFDGELGSKVWEGTADVAQDLNRDVTTRLPMEEAIAGQAPGVYVLSAKVPGADPYDTPPATQWFVLSDLGIATWAGIDGLTVSVRSLGTAGAVDAAEVTLLSRGNAVLGTAETDAGGVARFAPGLSRGTGSDAPALVTVERGEDMAFLSLTDPAFDLSDRGVEGREPAPPIDVFLATDRGAYRAGEVIHATALMRDETAGALPGVPLTAILTRPDGVEYSRVTSTEDAVGGHVFALPVAGTAPRGTWSVAVHTDVDAPALASETVLVEDFLPERMDVTLDLPERLRAGDTPRLGVQADYLFGAPAGDLAIEGEMLLRPVRRLDAFPGYVFGRYDSELSPRIASFADGVRTGADGAAAVSLDLPEVASEGTPLALTVTVRVLDASGRPVERQAEAEVLPEGPVIGLRPAFDDVVPEGTEARFDLRAFDRALSPVPMEVSWTVNRVRTEYQWYEYDGSWNWEPVTSRERVATGDATLGAEPVSIAAPVDWGRYEVIVERTDGAYVASSAEFYAGWYAPADATVTPDLLEASLDAEAYAPGDTATLRIVPRYAGTAVVTVMSNRLIAMETVEVSEGETLIPLTVTEEWGAGAYVSASVIRPMDVAAGRNPARALGLDYAPVDPGDKALSVTLDLPEEVRPRGPLTVGVEVDGVAPGETAQVTLAVVDVGILNLTGYDSPDPQGHYFGQRKLGVEMRDVYGRLLDGMNGALGVVRSGGDAGAFMQMQSPPPTEDLVAYFEGPVQVGPDGRAEVTVDLPAFNGTVRAMAVAWTRGGVGQAAGEVLVRDPVVVDVTVPRFLAPGDSSRMLLEVTHASGPTGIVTLDVAADGLDIAMPTGLFGGDVDEGGRFTRTLDISVPEDAAGLHEITVTATTPGGEELVRVVTLPVRLNDPEVAQTFRFTLAGGETFTFDDQVFSGYVPGTGEATLSVGPLARFDAPGLLATLDRYPYGCTEQLVSGALPLLYFDDVARAMGLAGSEDVGSRIDEAIRAVLANQSRNGSFGLWAPSSGDLWLDAYVTDFLSRAKARGRAVPDLAFESAIDNLRNEVNYYPDFDSGGGDLAYALMVLAREGAAAIGDLRYYADERGDSFSTPLAAAQLGAALAAYGEQRRADLMFGRASGMLTARLALPEDPVWRADYGTDRRDAAAVLTLAVEAGSEAVDRAALSTEVALPGEQVSTQEAVWTLLAANALIDDLRDTGVTIDGAAPEGPLVRVRDAQTRSAPVLIRNAGEAETELTLTTFGVPERPGPAGGNGYAIERSYYTMEGEAAEPSGLRVGTRLVAVLTVRPFGYQEARLMVSDPLPAGLEIDNPNLLRGGDVRALDWLDPVEGEAAEFRSDRFLAAVDWRSEQPFRLAYIVRAVSPGDFHHPAASVEDMYRPQQRAQTDSGRTIVVE